ncbi:MAG: TonB-dependent receptor [Micavibrio aeruginosavorus]|uniref:TonB-dependent receptor n=1 Tax=Micavibrio aeruginosavorus TaxID=349221 RepID=A0A7T5R0A0_9BACT|nr:MAG: TonB-dependent receptor [Micavibrio aeruginosavorus]
MLLSRNKLSGAVCAALAISCLCLPAQAQTIDYGSLEMLFGEPVTTSATGQPQRTSDVPVTMEIITAEDIRRSGAASIPDVLRTHSSLSVWAGARTSHDVNVRGFNQAYSPRLLVLVNGRQVYSDAYGNTFWQNIPVQLEEIRQIEIVEGPNSALFGFNAVSGVINIITYSPLYDDVSSAGVRVGTDSYREGHIVHTQKFGEKVGIRVSGGSTHADDFDEPPGTGAFYDPANHELLMDGIVQLTDDSQLRFEATKTKARVAEYPVLYTLFNSKYESSSLKTSYVADTGIGTVQANLYRNWLKLLHATSAELTIDYKNNVTVAQLEDLFKIGNDHTIRLQTEYRRNELTSNLMSAGSEIAYDVYAGGGMWNWQMRDDLAWINALRVDHLRLERSGPLLANPLIASNDGFDKSLTEISYNSGLVWRATEKDAVRLTTARGVQAPSLLDLGIDFPFGPITSLGNPGLDAGIVTNYEIGYDRRIEAINGLFRGGVFYQKTKDIKGIQALFTGLVNQPDNIGDSSSIGLELGLEGAFADHWTWDVDYTALRADDDLSVNMGGGTGATVAVPYNGEEATPTHTLNAHLGYANGPWEVDGYAQYVSDYDVLLSNGVTYDPVEAGDHVSLAGRVGYKVTDNVTVALSGQELNHTDVGETAGPEKERQVFLSLTASF